MRANTRRCCRQQNIKGDNFWVRFVIFSNYICLHLNGIETKGSSQWKHFVLLSLWQVVADFSSASAGEIKHRHERSKSKWFWVSRGKGNWNASWLKMCQKWKLNILHPSSSSSSIQFGFDWLEKQKMLKTQLEFSMNFWANLSETWNVSDGRNFASTLRRNF